MAVSLRKGTGISLAKGLEEVIFTIQWDTTDDLDIHAFVLQDGKAVDEKDFIYYNNPTHPNKSIEHSGDVRDGSKNALGTDDETITIHLKKLTEAMPQRDEILLTASIFDESKDFGDLTNAIAKIIDVKKNETLATYDLTTDLCGEVAGEIARLKKQSDNTWKFEAIGQGKISLESMVISHGIAVE